MNRAFSLTPLLRNSVGFDRFNDLFDTMMSGEEKNNSYPPYNIEKHGEEDYVVTLAVAGFTQDELDISLHNDRLRVSGQIKQSEDNSNVEYLYKGIAARAFECVFRLADHLKVEDAALKDGMLSIKLKREVPESAKPRSIPINQ